MITLHYNKFIVNLDFITGVSVGLEFYLGEDAAPEDVFAVTMDFVIIRITLLKRK